MKSNHFKFRLSLLMLLLIMTGTIMATETLKYTVDKTLENSIEVRYYKPHLVAEVTVEGQRADASGRAFRILAGFIFGGNQSRAKVDMTSPVSQQAVSEKIAMTAPVSQQALSENTSNSMSGPWLINFAMPEEYTLDTLPIPNDKRINVREVSDHKRVVIQFSGRITDKNINYHRETLQNAIKKYGLEVTGEPIYAFYNRPFTLPSKRRNEVMYLIDPMASETTL